MFLFIGAIILGGLIFYRVAKSAKFWEKQNVNYEPSWPIIGNIGKSIIRKKHLATVITDIYSNHPQQRYVGYMHFTRPILMLRDIELIKQMTVKDFHYFHDHFAGADLNDNNPASKTLLSLTGDNWRQMRSTISPVFASGKLKNMFQLIATSTEQFIGNFKGKEQVAVEIKDLFSRFAIDIIATIAFGIEVNSFKEPNNSFYSMSKKLNSVGLVQIMKILLLTLSKSLFKLLGLEFFSSEVSDFFRSVIEDNIQQREKSNIIRPDLINALLEAKKGKLERVLVSEKTEGFATVEEFDNGNNKTMTLTNDHIVGQAMLFFIAGFNTVSSASAFMAYELALNPSIQEKLQNEIDAIRKKNGKIAYEDLISMKYLDQVVSETLRKWPPSFLIDRMCTENYTIPPKHINDNEVEIKKGMSIAIPIIAIHRDPKYYPEPDRFDPERFSETNRVKIVSGSYIPFGVGPRNCIGSRFALLEIKILFFHLLSKVDILATNDTQIPIKVNPGSMDLAPKNGFKLSLRPRKSN